MGRLPLKANGLDGRLLAANGANSTAKNRRRYFRQAVALPVRMRLFDGSAFQAVTLDLSVKGARLLSPVGVRAGSKMRLKIGTGLGIAVRANVLGSRPIGDRYELRVVFEPLTPSAEDALHREVRAAERVALEERRKAARFETPAMERPHFSAPGDERRRSRRVRIETSGRIRVGTAYVNAKVLDISSGGAKIRLAQVVRVGEGVTFVVPGSELEVRGTVRSVRVRAKDLHFEIGITFEFADTEQARAVRAQILELRRQAETAAIAIS